MSEVELRVDDRVRVVKNPYSANMPDGYESTVIRKHFDMVTRPDAPEMHYYLSGKFEPLYFRERELERLPEGPA